MLKEKKHFIYVVFTYRQGMIIFFLLFVIYLLAFVEAGAAKIPTLKISAIIFAVQGLL